MPLCERLLKDGHGLRVLTRNVSVTQKIFNAPTFSFPSAAKIECFAWDGKSPVSLDALIDKETKRTVDAVIHLAGENIGQWPWTKKRKQRILDSRVVGTRSLIDSLASLAKAPKIMVSASAVGFYGDASDELKSENETAGQGFLADVVSAWEKEVFKAEALGIRTVALRNGIVLGRDSKGKMSGALGKMLPSFALGLGAVVGKGDQYWSWVHLKDTVEIFLHALNHENLSGPVNACAPMPVQQKEFGKTLAQVLHRPFLFSMPAFLIKRVLGEMSVTLLQSQRASAAKLQASGYPFLFPHLPEALEDLISKPK